MAAADQITVTELKQTLSTTGMDCNGLKTHLLERIKQVNLMHMLKNPEATKILLRKHEELQRGVDALGGEAKPETSVAETAVEEPAAAEETAAIGSETEPTGEPTGEPTAEEAGAATFNWKQRYLHDTGAQASEETWLPHISNFYNTGPEGVERTWDLDGW